MHSLDIGDLVGRLGHLSVSSDVLLVHFALPLAAEEGVAAVVPSAATGPKATATQQAFIRTLLLAQSPEGYKSLCRTIQWANRPQYEDIKCPLLIIAGSHDKTSPLGGSEHILQR